MRDYNGMKISEIKNNARTSVLNEVMNFLKTKYDTVEQVSNNKVAIAAGTIDDNDGCPMDIPVVIKVSCLSWYDKKAQTDNGRDVVRYDIYEEAQAYKNDMKANS